MKLTLRQKEVLEFLRDGFTAQEIADILLIGTHTVKHHVVDIRDRLGARNTVQAVVIAIRKGFIDFGKLSEVEVFEDEPSDAEFCDVCGHRVRDLSAHVQTEEHKRSVRRLDNTARISEPRLPVRRQVES